MKFAFYVSLLSIIISIFTLLYNKIPCYTLNGTRYFTEWAMKNFMLGRCAKCCINWKDKGGIQYAKENDKWIEEVMPSVDGVVPHITNYNSESGCFPLCENCWKSFSIEERLPFYKSLVLDNWKQPEKWENIKKAVENGL